MSKEEMIELAKGICKKAHAGQFDKAGIEYWKHPFAVAEAVTEEDEKICAYLHDVMEDTDFPAEELRESFGEDIFAVLLALTKNKGETYMDYVKRAGANPVARKVKLADLKHNMDISRIANLTETDKNRLKRYEKAKEYLESL